VAKHLRVWLRMTYRCCGMEWTDDWPEALKLECPDCGLLVEACRIADIADNDDEPDTRRRHPPQHRRAHERSPHAAPLPGKRAD